MRSGSSIQFRTSRFELMFFGKVPFDGLRERNSFLQECFFWGDVPFAGPLDAALRVQGTEFFLAKEYLAMEGGLAVCGDLFVRIAASSAAMTTCVVGVFFATYARLEGRGTRCRRQWSGSGTLESG